MRSKKLTRQELHVIDRALILLIRSIDNYEETYDAEQACVKIQAMIVKEIYG